MCIDFNFHFSLVILAKASYTTVNSIAKKFNVTMCDSDSSGINLRTLGSIHPGPLSGERVSWF